MTENQQDGVEEVAASMKATLYGTNLEFRTEVEEALRAQRTQGIRELLDRIQPALEQSVEINPSNYNHEDVCSLNNSMIQAVLLCRAEREKVK